jgi:hypothetical protein
MTEEKVLTEDENKKADRVNELASFIGSMFGTFGVDFSEGASALTVALVRASQTLFSISKESFLEMIGDTWETVAKEQELKAQRTGESIRDQILGELKKRGIDVKTATVRVERGEPTEANKSAATEVEKTLRTVISGAAGGE